MDEGLISFLSEGGAIVLAIFVAGVLGYVVRYLHIKLTECQELRLAESKEAGEAIGAARLEAQEIGKEMQRTSASLLRWLEAKGKQ